MADWTFETGDALTQKKWRNSWWIEARTESFFFENGMIGSSSENDIIVMLDDLEASQGDVITYGQVRELSGAGVAGDTVLEGEEEEPDTFDDTVTLDQRRNAVRSAGAMSSQRPSDKSLRKWAKAVLARWLAEIIDQDLFDSLGTTITKAIYGGDAVSTATIEDGDYMTLQLISKAVTFSKKTTPKIVGKNMGGKRYHVCVMSPDQAFDVMERDAAWAQAQREAMRRGPDNPIFHDALGVWRNTALHEHVRVPIATTWGGGAVNGATAYFMGVGAGVIAFAKRRVSNEKTFDYGNKLGFMVGSIWGTSKSVFDGNDNAFIGIRTFRSNN